MGKPKVIETRRIDELYHESGRPAHSMLTIATQFQQHNPGLEGIENAMGTAKSIREEEGVSINGIDIASIPGERDFYCETFRPGDVLKIDRARQKIEKLEKNLGTIVTGAMCCMNTLGDDEARGYVIERARALQHMGVQTYTIFAGNPADKIMTKLDIPSDPTVVSRPDTKRVIRKEYQSMVRELVKDIRKVYGGFILFENCPMQRTWMSEKLSNSVTNWSGTPYLLDALLEATEDDPGVGVMIDWSHLYNQCLYAHLGDHKKANEQMALFSEKWKDRIYSAHIKDTAARPGVVLGQGLLGPGTELPHGDGIWVARVAGDGQVNFVQALNPLHDYAQDNKGKAVCSSITHEIEDASRFDLTDAKQGYESVVRAGKHMDKNVIPVVYRHAPAK